MRKLSALCALALILAGCGASSAPPPPVPAAPPIPTSSPAGSDPNLPATATMAPPLVPAFPTSTVAFSGAGHLAGALPFALSGGTYHVSWNEQPIGPGWDLPMWSLDVSIHDPAGSSRGRAPLRRHAPEMKGVRT